MPIAKAIAQSQQSSLVSDDFHESPTLSSSRQQQTTSNVDSNSKIDDDYSDNPVKAYHRQQVEHQRSKRRTCAGIDSDIVENERFQFFILVCICINSLMIGVATFPMIKDNPELLASFNTADMVFLIIFTIEIAMQLFSQGVRYFANGWSVFDLLIVLISWASLSIKSLHAFRVFRVFRLITRVEVMRNVVVALFHVVPALTGIVIMLMLIMYIYAVLCTDLFKNYYPGVMSGDYFGRLDYSFFTLFQFICMDEWSGIAYEIVEVKYWYWIIFITFIVITAFVVVNLVIAVICDAVGILRKAEKAMLLGTVTPNSEVEEEDDSFTERNTLQRRIEEMEEMLDEVEIAQERMAETIKLLSRAILSRK